MAKTSSERREKSKREGIAQHWVTVQVQVPKDKKRTIIGLAANMRDDFKRNINR